MAVSPIRQSCQFFVRSSVTKEGVEKLRAEHPNKELEIGSDGEK